MEAYLVEGLVELGKLSDLSHNVLAHHVRSLDELVLLLAKERETVSDKSLVEGKTGTSKVVSAVADNVGSALGIVTADHEEQVAVNAQARARLLLTPGLDDLIVLLLAGKLKKKRNEALEGWFQVTKKG